MRLLLKLLIFAIFLTFSTNVFAQLQQPIDGVDINVSNENPKPGELVSVSVTSYNFDLGAASIVWLVNGKAYDQGIGVTKINVTTPKFGSKLDIKVIIKTSDGKEVQKAESISSSYVDIIWENDGYKPPFYMGKLPLTYQNKIKLIAIPHISKDAKNEINPKNLVYSWKSDGKYIENGQGYGIQSVEIEGDEIPKVLDITVDVTNREQTEHALGTLSLEPSAPSVSFYEDDSLYGILYNKALDNDVTLQNTEMRILAVPYGLNFNQNTDIEYNWDINSTEQTKLIRNRSIIVRTKGDTIGSSLIYLEIRNMENILQGVKNGFTIYFKKRQDQQDSNVF